MGCNIVYSAYELYVTQNELYVTQNERYVTQKKRAERFKNTFSRDNVQVHFVGVW